MPMLNRFFWCAAIAHVCFMIVIVSAGATVLLVCLHVAFCDLINTKSFLCARLVVTMVCVLSVPKLSIIT